MRIILNATSKKMGMDLLAEVSTLIPQVKAFMFPVGDNNCISLEFSEKANYTKDQTAIIYTLQSLERAQ